jgi:heme-degrading monooxygenase HmoA
MFRSALAIGDPTMFVGLSRFKVASGHEEEIAQAFRQRPGLVDQAPGFIRMEVMRSTVDAAEFWLFTWWDDEGSFETWHRSHAFKDAHAHMPAGLKLTPGANSITHLEVIAQ